MEQLLERQAVLAELTALSRRIGRGGGRVVLLRGEAGVGKTAVITRFISGVGPPLRVLRGWCDPLSMPRPLGPVIDVLAGLGGEHAAALVAAVDTADTAGLYARLLAVLGDGRHWVWVIEDVHWADGATLDLLRFLARRIAALPLLLVVSYRDDDLGAQHPLSVALGDIASCAALTRIGLDPLSRDAVAVLAAGSGINSDQLYRLTDGNPFYVTEVLAAGPDALSRDQLPRSAAEAVWARLARLSAPARDTVHAVAVCGPRTTPALLHSVCPAAPAGLDECLTAGVLLADGPVLRFRHWLARRATLDQIPMPQRRLLHKRAMAALAEPPIDPNALSALAFHADLAGDSDAVLRHGPGGAARAAELGAHSEAADLYAMVLRHAHTTPDRQKVIWLERYAYESYLCGRGDTATSSWRLAIDIRHRLGDRVEEADDLQWLSHQQWPMGRNKDGLAAARASLRILEESGSSPQLAWSLMNMTHWAAVTYDSVCADYAARTIALGTKLGDAAVVLRARGYAALASLWSGRRGWDDCAAVWREAMAGEESVEEVGMIGSAICWTAALHHDVDRAQRYIAETSAFCDERDFVPYQLMVIGAEALVALHRGDWTQASARAEDVLTRPGMGPGQRILALIALALTRARRGEQPVDPLLDEALENTEPDDFFRIGAVWAACAEAAWLAGDDDTACSAAQAGLAVAPAGADPWLVGALRRWVYLTGGEQPSADGDPLTPFDDEIRGCWQRAAQAWTDRRCPYDAAIAQLGGDIAAVQSAVGSLRGLGARAAARRAQQRLAVLRGPTRRTRAADMSADSHGLTRRQREVFELLAAGSSDAQIAAALHISPKTVEHHVGAILAKLRVENRTQAAALASSVDPPSRKSGRNLPAAIATVVAVLVVVVAAGYAHSYYAASGALDALGHSRAPAGYWPSGPSSASSVPVTNQSGALAENSTATDPVGDAGPNGADLTGFSWTRRGTDLQLSVSFAGPFGDTHNATIDLRTQAGAAGITCPGPPDARYRVLVGEGHATLFSLTGSRCGSPAGMQRLTATATGDGWTVAVPASDVGLGAGGRAFVRVLSSTQLGPNAQTPVQDYLPDESQGPLTFNA